MIPEAAVYLDLGWSIFPVNGKTPATAHGVKDATADEAQAERWFTNGKVGVALATGTPSGIWALDIDGKEGERKIERLQGEHGPLPTTLTSRTGNGFHLLFALPEGVDVRNSAGKIAPGIDVRGTGGYVVLPPSPHPSGGSYKWVKGRSLSDLKPVEAPFWLLKLAVAESNRTGSAEPLPEKIEQGRRNDRLASLAGSMRRRGATGASIAAALHEENRSRCHPPLRDAEVEKIAASISSYPSAKAEHGLTDTGNAARLVDLHGEQLHYIPQWGKWITWAGEAGRWELDHRDVLVRELAKDVGAALQRQATAERDDEKAKKIFAFARRSLNAHGINGMVDLARGIPSIPLDHEALDADGWLLGVEGGVVDLRTGTFRPPDQNGLITMQAPVRWDEAASAPRWEQALQEWFPDPEVRATGWRALPSSASSATTCSSSTTGSARTAKARSPAPSNTYSDPTPSRST
jgi:putative DNA primase/helicase